MTRLTWDDLGARTFQAGVDRGVFYNSENIGVAWNGLTKIKHKPVGGKTSAYYIDGEKFIQTNARVEFAGSIEAFTYPDEFSEYDGWSEHLNGLRLDQQVRREFGLTYRTGKGNALDGLDHGYLIHLVYNLLAEPASMDYETLNADTDPMNFSWDFTTRGVKLPGYAAAAHLTIDSTKTGASQLGFIEDYIYGTKTQDPRLPTIAELLEWFEDPFRLLYINEDPAGGLSPLTEVRADGDLEGRYRVGLYDESTPTRLNETSTDGLFVIE